jgi:hypothetical protein
MNTRFRMADKFLGVADTGRYGLSMAADATLRHAGK